MNRKTKFAVGSAVIVLAVATLIYSAVRETSAYFLTMEEYAAANGQHDGHSLRLAGRVAPGTVKWDPRTLDLQFTIKPIPPRAAAKHAAAGEEAEQVRAEAAPTDDPAAAPSDTKDLAPRGSDSAAANTGTTLTVRYNGILPDMFADDRDVIVEGAVQGGVFHAKALLTTCPSKYEADVPGSSAQNDPATTEPSASVTDWIARTDIEIG